VTACATCGDEGAVRYVFVGGANYFCAPCAPAAGRPEPFETPELAEREARYRARSGRYPGGKNRGRRGAWLRRRREALGMTAAELASMTRREPSELVGLEDGYETGRAHFSDMFVIEALLGELEKRARGDMGGWLASHPGADPFALQVVHEDPRLGQV
jgi:transcriptional regulator with XRE-family HTH domain